MLDLDRQILFRAQACRNFGPDGEEGTRPDGKICPTGLRTLNQIDLPYEKKAAAMTLKSYRDSLAYATEELNQLKKMYEADDLTEETEEIILQRTKNQVDRAKFLLEGAIKRDKQFNEVVVPREVISIEDAYDRKKLSMATIRKILPWN